MSWLTRNSKKLLAANVRSTPVWESLHPCCLSRAVALHFRLSQDLLEDDAINSHGTDASGNPILKDIGTFLKAELKGCFKDADIKYIDPSYIIRCGQLQHMAAMPELLLGLSPHLNFGIEGAVADGTAWPECAYLSTTGLSQETSCMASLTALLVLEQVYPHNQQ